MESSINDVTLEGERVQTLVTTCDVGGRGFEPYMTSHVRQLDTAGLVFTFITFPLCTFDDHFSSSVTMSRP